MESVHRRFRLTRPSILVVLALSLVSFSFEAQSESAPTSVLKGVYSEEQSKRGEKAYADECGRCHKEDLMGGALEPPLTGPEFFRQWGGSSIAALFENIRDEMPSNDKKGTLPPPLIADVIAYMLKFNGIPAGTTEISTDVEALKNITIEAAP